MPKINCNDKSWETTWLSLYGWLYPSKWAKSDAEMKNEVLAAYADASKSVNSLGPQTGDLASQVDEWKATLKGYERTITYSEANDVISELRDIESDAREQFEVDRQLIAARKKKPKQTQSSSASRADDTSLEVSDEQLAALLGHSHVTAKNKPSKITPKPRPYVPPTPQELWVQTQRDMATQCDNTIQYGAHAVDQQSVLQHLRLGPNPGVVVQSRPGPENSHVRIIKAGRQHFWTSGLSHQGVRDDNRFMVYKRDGETNRFSHVSGIKHPKEVP